jgi:hypothetical protein
VGLPGDRAPAVGLCCLAAVPQSVVSLWVTVALIVPALVLMLIRLATSERELEDALRDGLWGSRLAASQAIS